MKYTIRKTYKIKSVFQMEENKLIFISSSTFLKITEKRTTKGISECASDK
jgi:hypothetical protein